MKEVTDMIKLARVFDEIDIDYCFDKDSITIYDEYANKVLMFLFEEGKYVGEKRIG